MNSALKKYLAILALYLVLTLVLTYPLALNLNTHIPGHDTDGPAQTWSLWWTRYALLDLGQTPFTTDALFYPLGLNLVAYTPVFLNGILSIPLQLAFGVIVAQNLMVYFALVSGAFGAYLFVREVLARGGGNKGSEKEREGGGEGAREGARRQEIAAVTAGALYGFGAWHLNYVVAGHFMLISNQWLPFYALYLMRLGAAKPDRSPRPTRFQNAALAGLFVILTAWTELTFVPFLVLLSLFYLVYVLVAERATFLPILGQLAAVALVAAVGMLPLVISLALDFQRYGYYLAAGVGRIQIFSAEPISFFLPSGQHPLLGAWSESITRANTSYAFIGWAALALAIVGFYVERAASLARFWGFTALLFALLMFGSTLYLNGENTNVPMPFALLRLVPFANANRYPARFNVMLMLALVPLVAWGVLALLNARRPLLKYALAGLLALLLFEQLVLPIPLTNIQVPAVFELIRAEADDATVLELPLGWRGSIVMQGETDDVAQFFQTVDHKRRLGGITSRFPDFKLRYFEQAPVLRSLIAVEEGRAVSEQQLEADRAARDDVLRFFNIRYVSALRAQVSAEALALVRNIMPLQEIYADGARVVYRVEVPAPPAQRAIDPGSDSARLLFDDSWGQPQQDNAGFGYRWATEGRARMWLPLERAEHEVVMNLRGAFPGQRVELRVNGQAVGAWTLDHAWQEVRASVPAAVLRDGLDELVFVTETAPLERAAPDDRIIGGTGVTAPVDIAATGAGFDAGKFGSIFVAGRNMIPNTRGYHLVAIDPQTGKVDAVGSFDTFADEQANVRLIEFVDAQPPGEIVAGVTIDDASFRLANQTVTALQALGVAGDVRTLFRAGQAFVGIKGLAPGQAVEDMNTTMPANVAIGKNVDKPQVSFALGPFVVNAQQ